MKLLDGALRVLAALDGPPLPRPSAAPYGVIQRLCRNAGCNVQIVIARLAGGQWAALDRSPDSGELVIVNGIVVERGPHHADAPAYVFHRCNPKEVSNG